MAPNETMYLLEWFFELSSGRSYSQNGPNPIAFSDIMAWNTLFKKGIQPWEIRAVKAIDLEFITIHSEDILNKNGSSGNADISVAESSD